MKKINVAHSIPYYGNDGSVDSLQPLEECIIETSIGELTPIYLIEDHGRKKLTPVKFHKNGSVKSVSLQTPYTVKTGIGEIKAELITFYPDGSLCRIFPLNGKLSGYWGETDEYKLAESVEIPTGIGTLKTKPINYQFYSTGSLKSMTLWPGERISVKTPEGELKIRKGLSFFKDGSIQSCEPAEPLQVSTPIGKIRAFDPLPEGMDGNRNSLVFNESGEVCSLTTTLDSIRTVDNLGLKTVFSPHLKESLCSDKDFVTQPLKIGFDEQMVIFSKGCRTSGKMHLTSDFTVEEFNSKIKTQVTYCS